MGEHGQRNRRNAEPDQHRGVVDSGSSITGGHGRSSLPEQRRLTSAPRPPRSPRWRCAQRSRRTQSLLRPMVVPFSLDRGADPADTGNAAGRRQRDDKRQRTAGMNNSVAERGVGRRRCCGLFKAPCDDLPRGVVCLLIAVANSTRFPRASSFARASLPVLQSVMGWGPGVPPHAGYEFTSYICAQAGG